MTMRTRTKKTIILQRIRSSSSSRWRLLVRWGKPPSISSARLEPSPAEDLSLNFHHLHCIINPCSGVLCCSSFHPRLHDPHAAAAQGERAGAQQAFQLRHLRPRLLLPLQQELSPEQGASPDHRADLQVVSRCIDLWISAMIISASSRYQRETGNSN